MPDDEKDFRRVGELLGDFCEAAAVSPSERPDEHGRRGREERVSEAQAAGSPAARTPDGLARALASAWPDIAGPEVAANATPVQLKAGRLVVSTSSSVWAHTLQYMSDDLVARLNKLLGPGSVKQIAFRHAGWEERPRVAPAYHGVAEGDGPPGTLTAEQQEAIARLAELDLPPAIRESVARAMRASFDRDHRKSVR